jgi:hypothetical protein
MQEAAETNQIIAEECFDVIYNLIDKHNILSGTIKNE